MTSARKTRVAVVFGGRSTEHAVSCAGAGAILSALDPAEFDVVPVGITRAGRWVLIPDGAPAEVTEAAGEPVPSVRAFDGVDVVFPVLHGAYGEDGTIQGLFEMAGIPYVGAGVFASAAALDKEFTKKLAAASDIPVVPYAVLRAGATLTGEDRSRLGLPVFVKPARAGSSHGITKVKDWSALDEAIAHARTVDPKVLVEAAVTGREIECGVLEAEAGTEPEVSVLAEARVPEREFLDFEAKYRDGESDIPARLPEPVARRVRDHARAAFTAFDCAGLARIDFFVTPGLDVYLNEINTMPGFTPRSMFPAMWAATGVDLATLVTRLIRTALHRGAGLH